VRAHGPAQPHDLKKSMSISLSPPTNSHLSSLLDNLISTPKPPTISIPIFFSANPSVFPQLLQILQNYSPAHEKHELATALLDLLFKSHLPSSSPLSPLLSLIPQFLRTGSVLKQEVNLATILHVSTSYVVLDLIESTDDDEYCSMRQIHEHPWSGPASNTTCVAEQDSEALGASLGASLETWEDVSTAGIALFNLSKTSNKRILTIGSVGAIEQFIASHSHVSKTPSFFSLDSNSEISYLAERFFSGPNIPPPPKTKHRRRKLLKPPCSIIKLDKLTVSSGLFDIVIVCLTTIVTSSLLRELSNVLASGGVIIYQHHSVDPGIASVELPETYSRRRFEELFTRDHDDENDDSTNRSTAFVDVVSASPRALILNESLWQDKMCSSTEFNPRPVPLSIAQNSCVMQLPTLLSAEEVARIIKLGDSVLDNHEKSQPRSKNFGVEVRSALSQDDSSWKVAFLQTDNKFQEEEQLLAKISAKVLEQAKAQWANIDLSNLNVRCVEYHKQVAPGPGISDLRHYDMDSVFTVDILLSEPGSFTGGVFQTLEFGDSVAEHEFGASAGDAVAFVSHKFHAVGKVETGTRRVCVVEWWRGPARTCPHRCESLAKGRCRSELGFKVGEGGGWGRGGSQEFAISFGRLRKRLFALGWLRRGRGRGRGGSHDRYIGVDTRFRSGWK